MAINVLNGLLALGMLLTGCVNTISKKGQNESEVAGWHGVAHKFKHPWFQTLIMFIGESFCLLGFAYQCWSNNKQRRNDQESAPLLADGTVQKPSTPPANKPIWQPVLIIPTFLDLLGTTFGGIGLIYCAPSIWQMLRGSIVIFTGLLSWIFLKRRLPAYRMVAMGFTVLGLICVGITGALNARDDNNNKKHPAASSSEESVADELLDGALGDKKADEPDVLLVLFGMVMILLGQLVGAAQMVVEEKLLKHKELVPMHIVGMEGMFGTIAMIVLVLPITFFIPGTQPSPLGYDVYENSVDAIIQIFSNIPLLLYSMLYLSSIAFYNFFGLSVTKQLSCVHRTLIDACRTIVVWGFGLTMWYTVSWRAGERFTRWSFIQVLGFGLLITGTILYNGIIKLPGFNYETAAAPSSLTPPPQKICPAGPEESKK